MTCQYCSVGAYNDVCVCNKDNDICPFMRRCDVNHVWLPLNSMVNCTKQLIKPKRKECIELKNGEYIVEYVQGGKLYVRVEDQLIRMVNPYDYEPDKVKLVKVGNAMYIEDFAPKKEEKKSPSKQIKE